MTMLKGIHAALSPDLLKALAEMGHGDEIVIADGNFPAGFMGPRVVRADGVGAVEIAEAILTHMPLDTFEHPAFRMEVVGKPQEVPEICREFQEIINRLEGDFPITSLERFAFYERARRAAVIVATSETRIYANLILKKGVVMPG